VREALGIAGTLIGTLAPLFFIAWLGSEARAFSFLSITVSGITVIFIFVCFFSVKENPEFQKQTRIAVVAGLKAFARNRPFRTLVVAFVVALIGNAFVPILVLYIGDYLVIAPEFATPVIITYILAQAASIPFWIRLSRRIGKKEAWTRALILGSVTFAAGNYLHEGTWLAWIVMALFAGCANGCTMAMAPSMMADVIDMDELETGRRREGAYFGIWSFIDKSAIGVAVFIGMYALELTGYVPNQAQEPQVIWTLRVLYCVLPAICFATGAYLLRYYPITFKEHSRIRRLIEEKKRERTA
jgi:GPH family glycoside/pentoside/hexuronide:cation symporter